MKGEREAYRSHGIFGHRRQWKADAVECNEHGRKHDKGGWGALKQKMGSVRINALTKVDLNKVDLATPARRTCSWGLDQGSGKCRNNPELRLAAGKNSSSMAERTV
jgi:hypothetical protein